MLAAAFADFDVLILDIGNRVIPSISTSATDTNII